ncbi:MAG: serine hydrolase [Actinomycetota bacterium]
MKDGTGRASRAMRTGLGTALAAVVALGALEVPARAASPLMPHGVFDAQQTGWHYRTGMTLGQYQDYFAEQTKTRLQIDIEADEIDGEVRYMAVFQDKVDGRGQYVLRDMTKASFAAENSNQLKNGMRLVDLEIYQSAGAERYAAIWLGNPEKLDHHLTQDHTVAQLTDYTKRMVRDGFIPADVELYPTSQGWRYAVIWLENIENLPFKLLVGLSSTSYASYFDQLKREYRPIDIESNDVGKQVYAVIWVGNPSERLWYARRDMNQIQFDNYKRYYEDLGYRATDLEVYQSGAGLRYASIWRQNSDRPNWELRQSFDSSIEQAVQDWNLPGMGVVVMQNGKTLYRRGFGHADIAGGRWWDSETTGRLASISKAITGTLAVDLDAAGILDLEDPISQWLPEIPASHNYTVGDLGSMAACIAHSGDLSDGSFMGSQYDTALEAAEQFWADPSVHVCTLPAASDYYSTPSYTIQGAALEAATTVSLSDLIREVYSVPLGLSTLRAEDPDTAHSRRTVLYQLNGDEELEEVSRDNMSWKLGGGGMEASPADVARWGAALMGGQILDSDGLTKLWDSPFGAADYANGWSLDPSELGRQVVAKTGGQRGAKTYIRMYPEEEVVVVVMTNRDALDGEDHFAKEMGKQLGTEVLNWIDG